MLFLARLRGWFFRHRMLRSNSYRSQCLRCYSQRTKEHRPCFEPKCHCWCSRFHNGKYPIANPDWNGLLTKP